MFKKLQNRLLLCYLISVFIPIVLLSAIIYFHQTTQQMQDNMENRLSALTTEQNALESQLTSAETYYKQFQSNYELQHLLKGFYTSEREVVYSYNSQIHSLISGVDSYDKNLSQTVIYTENQTAADILKYFLPIEECPFSADSYPLLTKGIWTTADENSPEGSLFTFYKSFSNPPLTRPPGILKLSYNSRIFSDYASRFPDTSVFIYLNNELIYSQDGIGLSSSPEQYIPLTQPDDPSSPSVAEDSSHNYIVSSFFLNGDSFYVLKITPDRDSILSYPPFIISVVTSCMILIIASFIFFRLLFRAMHNLAQLSEHMSRQNTPTITPYTGNISSDETGELALAFNQMVTRINTLSSTVHNHEMQLKDAQLEALQAQLNPHFFYGTLESIRMIAEANHQTLISEIAFSFGNLMRYSLSGEHLVLMNKEIEVTKQYISIQKKRLINRFEIEWDICEFDDQCRCPKFALFSMVENVFSHNVSKCREFIRIFVSIRAEDADLIITVRNTGPGVSLERLNELHYLLEHPQERAHLKSEHNGRSILNINDRLKLFYGDNYSFTIESIPGTETVCSVRIRI